MQRTLKEFHRQKKRKKICRISTPHIDLSLQLVQLAQIFLK